MSTDLQYNITVNLALFGLGYIIGYAIGRLDLILRRLCNCGNSDAQSSAFAQKILRKPFADNHDHAQAAIKIDESKYVGEISTDNLTKNEAAAAIGNITAAADDISASVSKLARRKGK